MLRGIAIFLVLISHYAVWIGEIFHSDLLEYGLGRFGVYGVDLFFVVSGYGLVKSVGKKRINGTFLWKRFKAVYLPYLLIVGLIAVYDGGISGMTGWVSFLTGQSIGISEILWSFIWRFTLFTGFLTDRGCGCF